MTRARFFAASLVLLIAAAPGGAPAAPTQTYEELMPAAVVVSDHDLATYLAARDVVEANGAHGVIGYPPDVIFGRFEKRLDRSLFGDLDVAVVASASDLASADLDAILRNVVGALFTFRESIAAMAPAGDTGPIDDVLLRVPENLVSMTTPRGPRCGSAMDLMDRGMSQNSEFMMGSVLLNLIFPESVGQIENWTDQEIADALTGTSLGLAEYQRVALWTDLSFTINKYVRVPVSTEPIHSNMDRDGIWIGEVLDHLGYGDGALLGAHELNNAMRKQYKTEWAYTSIIVDMSNHYNNYTADSCWGGAGYVAYSYLGGPYMLIPFPACRYGPGLGFGRVFIHEMSHGFWALDEYASAQVGCGERSGYLAVANRNTLFQPCIETVPCIMQTASPPFTSPLPICEYTMGQVGLVDNGNSVPVIFDKAPQISFVGWEEGQVDYLLPDETEFQLEAIVTNDAVPNVNPYQSPMERMDVAPYIRSCEVSIQGEPFVEVPGIMGVGSANVHFIYRPVLEPGLNSLLFKATNRVYYKAQLERQIYQYGIKYYQATVSPEPDVMNVRWVTGGEVFGAVFDLYRTDVASGGSAQLLTSITHPLDSSLTRRVYTYEDRNVVPGRTYVYKITARFSFIYPVDHQRYDYAVSSKDIEETALVPPRGLVSSPMPNPAVGGEDVAFTVDIPRSYATVGDESATRAGATAPRGASAATETKTPVKVVVFNVLGQRVRTLYENSRFGGYMTFKWNGTDSNGNRVTPGVYFVSVWAGEKKDSRKIVILR